jgi:hypothetical protein
MPEQGDDSTANRAEARVRDRVVPAAALASAAAAILVVLIYVGSGGLRDFDAALIGYAAASVFALAAVVYRYALWITRPPTGLYLDAGWSSFLSWRNFRRYTTLVPVALWTQIFGQTFILKRGTRRWAAHMAIFWGVLLSLLITFPLTFGWFRFTLVPPRDYRVWVVGLPLFQFPVESIIGFVLYHGLDVTAVLLLVGLALAFGRRLTDLGLLATQRFEFDLLPLILLFLIAVTGLALTASSLFYRGAFYWFISLTHQLVVVTWLLSLPFGKFFHIVERPASIGVNLYQTVYREFEQTDPPSEVARCGRCGQELPSQRFIADLKTTLAALHQDYTLGDSFGSLLDYCPTCKRVLRGEAYFQLMKNRFL